MNHNLIFALFVVTDVVHKHFCSHAWTECTEYIHTGHR